MFFVSTHTLTQQDAFGSSCFFSTHRTGCPWLLTEQDAFGSSCGFQLTGRSEAPHVVVLVQFPNVCFCSKNTEYGKQLSAPQACNCAKSVFFFASFEMGSNASKPPAPASSRLSDEDMQELVGRLVSLLPAPMAPPAAAAVPVPVFGAAPPLPPPPGPPPGASTVPIAATTADGAANTADGVAAPAVPFSAGDSQDPNAYVRVCLHCGHMSYFRNGICFNPHCVTCTVF